MLSVLGWIIFGLIIGALAKLVMPGKDPGGIIVTMLIGIGPLSVAYWAACWGCMGQIKSQAFSCRSSERCYCCGFTDNSPYGEFRRTRMYASSLCARP